MPLTACNRLTHLQLLPVSLCGGGLELRVRGGVAVDGGPRGLEFEASEAAQVQPGAARRCDTPRGAARAAVQRPARLEDHDIDGFSSTIRLESFRQGAWPTR